MALPCQWKRGCANPGTLPVSLKLNEATRVCHEHLDALLSYVDSTPLRVVKA